jgi:hypothetical protein
MDVRSEYPMVHTSQWVKNSMFGHFRPYIAIREKRYLYSFVEQVKLYRLVYNSILILKKIPKNNYGY